MKVDIFNTENKYKIIYADPAWLYRDKAVAGGRGAGCHYTVTSLEDEIVRHRVASYAQESTRYCNYNKSGDVAFIRPVFFAEDTPEMDNWVDSCMRAEKTYNYLISEGRTPQEARSVLPNSLKTEVVMTANLREWRHFLSLRACGSTGKPHPQMLEVTVPLLKELRERVPVVFDDLEPMEWETVK